ncbi:MAG: hypothetical protein IV086_16760 [Hyphomonadaceae bacterium]|nr:MAG: hypothetical protein FD160_2012 [Caulobacteraceae bacterium]MBT9447354.1 hypothetical protein [Hyphomonadaceae bacterium]TPW03131.1 MAG: hypothetical protein FD124_3121 [Alphaproteobacteria bacterium]
MRRFLAATALAAVAIGLAACATPTTAPTLPPSSVTSAGVWAYSFDAGPGIATAILTGADGRTLVRLQCQAPRGDLIVTDWTFSRVRQGEVATTVTVGSATKSFPARVAGDGAGRQALAFTLPTRDPLWNALTPAATVKTEGGGFTHVWAAESASRINDVLNSCRALGS